MKDGKIEPRYRVTHKDGKPVNPNHRLFILSVDTDPYARRAACYYASICSETHPELAEDMIRHYGLDCSGSDKP